MRSTRTSEVEVSALLCAGSVRRISLICILAFLSTGVLAEDRTQPTIESFIGGWAFSGDHSYMAESRVQVPFLCLEPFRLTYDYHEVTPVLKEHLQTQLLTA